MKNRWKEENRIITTKTVCIGPDPTQIRNLMTKNKPKKSDSNLSRIPSDLQNRITDVLILQADLNTGVKAVGGMFKISKNMGLYSKI